MVRPGNACGSTPAPGGSSGVGVTREYPHGANQPRRPSADEPSNGDEPQTERNQRGPGRSAVVERLQITRPDSRSLTTRCAAVSWARVAPKVGRVSRPRLRDGDEAVERH